MLEGHLEPFKDEDQKLAYLDAVYERRKLLSPKMANLIDSRKCQIYEEKGDKENYDRGLNYYIKAKNPAKALKAWESYGSDNNIEQVISLFAEKDREKVKRKAHANKAKSLELCKDWRDAVKHYDLAGDFVSHAACVLRSVQGEDSRYLGTEASKKAVRYFLNQDENYAAAEILKHARAHENSVFDKAEFGCILVEKDLIEYNEKKFYLPKILNDCKSALSEAVENRRVMKIKRLNSVVEKLSEEVKEYGNSRY